MGKEFKSIKLNEEAPHFQPMKGLPILIFGDKNEIESMVWDMTKNRLFNNPANEDDYDNPTDHPDWNTTFDSIKSEYFNFCILDKKEQDNLAREIKKFNDFCEREGTIDTNKYDLPNVKIIKGSYEAFQLYCDITYLDKDTVKKVKEFFEQMKQEYGLSPLNVSYQFMDNVTNLPKIEEEQKVESDEVDEAIFTLKDTSVDESLDEGIDAVIAFTSKDPWGREFKGYTVADEFQALVDDPEKRYFSYTDDPELIEDGKIKYGYSMDRGDIYTIAGEQAKKNFGSLLNECCEFCNIPAGGTQIGWMYEGEEDFPVKIYQEVPDKVCYDCCTDSGNKSGQIDTSKLICYVDDGIIELIPTFTAIKVAPYICGHCVKECLSEDNK